VIPGLNLLAIAGGVVQFQTVQWYRFVIRRENERGQWLTEYALPQPLSGSWQPASDSTIRDRGLDATKLYYNLYTAAPVEGVQRGAAPDQIIYNDRRHDVVGGPDWYTQDGWRGILCVDVGPA